jgi:hypothetical protein
MKDEIKDEGRRMKDETVNRSGFDFIPHPSSFILARYA